MVAERMAPKRNPINSIRRSISGLVSNRITPRSEAKTGPAPEESPHQAESASSQLLPTSEPQSDAQRAASAALGEYLSHDVDEHERRSAGHEHLVSEKSFKSSIVRAVTSADVLRNHGKQLRNRKGNKASYSLSFPTRDFDGFLSHSWRDSGFLKYLALCYYYNRWHATLAGFAAAMVASYLNVKIGSPLPIAEFPSMCAGDLPRRTTVEISAAFVATFLLVLLYGHSFLPTFLLRPKKLFLDKVCIDQTDPVRKRAGIVALDSFIHASKNMIVLYNNDYLERLWCVYELAAYTAFDLKEDGSNIVFLPLLKAPTVLGMMIVLYCFPLGEYIVASVGGNDAAVKQDEIDFAERVAPAVIISMWLGITASVLMAGAQRMLLADQLSTFSVDAGKVSVDADRELIESAIEGWYQRQDGKAPKKSRVTGIERFEKEVRAGKVFHGIVQKLGTERSGLSLADTVIATLPLFVTSIDYLLDNPFGRNMFTTMQVGVMAPLFVVLPHLIADCVLPLRSWMLDLDRVANTRVGLITITLTILAFAVLATVVLTSVVTATALCMTVFATAISASPTHKKKKAAKDDVDQPVTNGPLSFLITTSLLVVGAAIGLGCFMLIVPAQGMMCDHWNELAELTGALPLAA